MSSEDREVIPTTESTKDDSQSATSTTSASSVEPVEGESVKETGPSPTTGKKRSREEEKEEPQEKSGWDKVKDNQKKKKTEPEGPNAHVKAMSQGEAQFSGMATEMAEFQYKFDKWAAGKVAQSACDYVSDKWSKLREKPELTAEEKEEMALQLDDQASQMNDISGTEMQPLTKPVTLEPTPTSMPEVESSDDASDLADFKHDQTDVNANATVPEAATPPPPAKSGELDPLGVGGVELRSKDKNKDEGKDKGVSSSPIDADKLEDEGVTSSGAPAA